MEQIGASLDSSNLPQPLRQPLSPVKRKPLPFGSPTSPRNPNVKRKPVDTGARIILPNMATVPAPPRESSRTNPLHIDITHEDGPVEPTSLIPLPSMPRSPGIVLQNFFGWKPREESSSIPTSPSISPHQTDRNARPPPMSLDIPKANAASFAVFGNTSATELPTPPASSSQINELEMELREISTELAQSIKREMELEEEVERLRALTADQRSDAGRRTSDYFSDYSGTSSRYGGATEDPVKLEELEKSRRKAELEKAQVKLEMSNRMAEVMKQRRMAEDRIHLLEEHVQSQSRAISPALPDPDRLRQLEITVEEMRRKLDEERRNKASMEELIGGMRHEIEQYKSERDKLKDEVVPSLESKLANLEYFPDSIPELNAGARPALARSKSSSAKWANGRSRSNSNAVVPPGQRSRSGSFTNETREQLVERAKDLETHKDALHVALKQLLERHKLLETQYARKLKILEQDRSKQSGIPRKAVFHSEVKNLRGEIIELRKRADEALDQKWQTEKGLSGLRLDLDRAREETDSLRALLKSHDISVPASPRRKAAGNVPKSLDKAYAELTTTHALSIAHLKDLGSPNRATFGDDTESSNILDLLKKSLSTAESERDAAHAAAEQYRSRARQLQQTEITYLSKQADMSAELLEATGKMDELAEQVHEQLLTNNALRKKLAGALHRGEKEQKTSEGQVRDLEGKLRSLEDQLVNAQQANEAAMASHEEDAKIIRESERTRFQRSATLSSAVFKPSPGSGHSSGAASPMLSGVRSSRFELKESGGPKSLTEATGTTQLETRVQALERALAEAENEMSEVVSRMNRAQMEVAELQGERDEAAMRSRKLQVEVVEQREKVRVLMAKSGQA